MALRLRIVKTSLAFRGSKNQRIIDVQNSLKQNQIIELDF